MQLSGILSHTSSVLIWISFVLTVLCIRTARADAVITNGVVTLGVKDAGSLVTNGTVASSAGLTMVGLRLNNGQYESLAEGCACEGWGVSWGTSSSIFAHSGWFGTSPNLIVSPLQTTGSTSATSTVTSPNNVVRVTHAFSPAPTQANAFAQYGYEVVITIQNLSPAALTGVKYRRVADWDIEPTRYSGILTVQYAQQKPGQLLSTTNYGFASPNPLTPDGTAIGFSSGLFDHVGPSDISVLFDFSFGDLPANSQIQFKMYYGAAPTEFAARQALTVLRAEVYSLGQSSSKDDTGRFLARPAQPQDKMGAPATFFLGFSGVSIPTTPAPNNGGATGNTGTNTTTTTPGSTTNSTQQILPCLAGAPSILSIVTVNNKFVTIAIVGVVSPSNKPVTVKIISIAQNEPVTGGIGSNGDLQLYDAIINTPSGTAQVRASRTSAIFDRLYYIGYIARDVDGAACSGMVVVTVPVDPANIRQPTVYSSVGP